MFSLNLSSKGNLHSDVNGSCPHRLITACTIFSIGASGQPKSCKIHTYKHVLNNI